MSIADAIATLGIDNVIRLIVDAPNTISEGIQNAGEAIRSIGKGSASTPPPEWPNFAEQIAKLRDSFNKYQGHIFHPKHNFSKIGSDKRAIFNKLVDIVSECKDQLVNGDNNIITKINGEIVTIRIHIENNVIMNMDAFVGTSNRVVDHLIYR